MPEAEWHLVPGEKYCSAIRSFSQGDRKFELEYRTRDFSHNYRLVIRSSHRSTWGLGITTRLAPYKDKSKSYAALRGHTAKGWIELNVLTRLAPKADSDGWGELIPRAELDQWLSEVESVEIVEGFGSDIVLATGRMDQVRLDLEDCLAKLVEQWGFDGETHRTLSEIARPKDTANFRSWFRGALREAGRDRDLLPAIDYRLTIDEQGRVVECNTFESGELQMTAQIACPTILKYKRFKPARAVDGAPIRSFYWANYLVNSGF